MTSVKKELENAGFYLFNSRIKTVLPQIGSIETGLFEKLRWAFEVYDGPWFDVGTPQSYQDAVNLLKDFND